MSCAHVLGRLDMSVGDNPLVGLVVGKGLMGTLLND